MNLPPEMLLMLQKGWLLQLYTEFDEINQRRRLNLTRPLLRISDSKSHWGLWDPQTRTLSLSQQLILKHPWDTVINVLKHEMAHQWVYENYEINGDIKSHGSEFLTACEKVNVPPLYRKSGITLGEVDLAAVEKSAWSTNTAGEINPAQALLQKAEKLLALAQSDNENEALLAMQKVQELYAKYNLDVFQRPQPLDFAYKIIRLNKQKIETHQQLITSILTGHFFVSVVISYEFEALSFKKLRTLEIMGTPQNVAMAEYVFHFLENTSRLLTASFVQKSYRPDARTTRLLTKSYRLGVLNGFAQKLKENEQRLEKQSFRSTADTGSTQVSTSKAISLVQNDARLNRFVRERFPYLANHSSSASSVNTDAYKAGVKEGNNLILRKGINGHKNFSGGLIGSRNG